ncbi:MAG TPA: CDP-alcohol phosphatidyltransferase family protein [Anaerolineales bacterium]|nr:CDP-alcohol phosphatidyltransferase family protein [Anaerolineales bacterium]
METAENRGPILEGLLESFSRLPNRITAVRLLLVPLMWVFAVFQWPFFIGVGLILAGLTDILDGLAAKLLNQVSESGSKLDSVADFLVFLSAIIWIAMFRPEIISDHSTLASAAVLINLASLLVGWRKFRRFANLHLYSSKAAAAAAYIFFIHAFLIGDHRGLFYLATGLYILSSIEALVLQLSRSVVDENSGSILLDPGFRVE